MANRPNQKLRLLFLLKILMEKTDSTHGLTTQQIIEELAYYDLEAERKAIYRDLQTLRDFGLVISQQGGKEWRLVSRPLDLQELIMLVDAVQSSPFLTDELTDHLIGKLQRLASLDERELMHKRVDVPSRVKMQNSDALRNIDLIQQAMRTKRKINFRYFHYDAAKQKVLNRDGKTYAITPVRLIYSDELYYLIGFRDRWAHAGAEHSPFTPYRVDRMLGVEVSEERATKDPRIANYVLEDHVSPSFGVYAADKTTIVLELDERAMNPLIDKFGLGAVVFENKDGRLLATVKAPLSPQFFGWLLQLSTFIKILSPQRAVDMYLDMLDQTCAQYQQESR